MNMSSSWKESNKNHWCFESKEKNKDEDFFLHILDCTNEKQAIILTFYMMSKISNLKSVVFSVDFLF